MIHPCPVAPRLQCCGYLNVYAQCRSKHERTGRRLIACEAVFLAAKSTSRPQKAVVAVAALLPGPRRRSFRPP